MSPREQPSPDAWLVPEPTDLDFVTQWVVAWNARTGDSAVVGPDLRIRDRRPDPRYSGFIAAPIVLSPSHAPEWPLYFRCHAMFPDGSEAASVAVRAGGDALAEHEVSFSITAAWWDGWAIRPDEMVFTLQWRSRQA